MKKLIAAAVLMIGASGLGLANKPVPGCQECWLMADGRIVCGSPCVR